MSRWPDWQDAGRAVTLTMRDGSTVTGVLRVDDFVSGEDEVPIFGVHERGGRVTSFVEAVEWEFVDGKT